MTNTTRVQEFVSTASLVEERIADMTANMRMAASILDGNDRMQQISDLYFLLKEVQRDIDWILSPVGEPK